MALSAVPVRPRSYDRMFCCGRRRRIFFVIFELLLFLQLSVSFQIMLPRRIPYVERTSFDHLNFGKRHCTAPSSSQARFRTTLLSSAADASAPNEDDDNRKNSSEPPQNQQEYSSLSLFELLNELNDRKIAFSPSSTRNDLEMLLMENSQKASNGAEDSKTPPESSLSDNKKDEREEMPPSNATSSAEPVTYPSKNVSEKFKVENVYALTNDIPVKKSQQKPSASANDARIRSERRRHRQESFESSRHRKTSRPSPSTRPSPSQSWRPGGDDEDVYYDSRNINNDDLTLEGRELRRNRRRQRQQQQQSRPSQPPPPPGSRRARRQQRQAQEQNTMGWVDDTILSPVKNVIPDKWVNVGVKATNVAKRKTGQLWNDLVDLTYENEIEDDIDEAYGYRARKRRRQARQQRQQHYRDDDIVGDTDTGATRRRKRDFISNKFRRRGKTAPTSPRTSRMDKTPRKTAKKDDSTSTRVPIREVPIPSRPIADILKELNDLNILYTPTSSRQDLEDLLTKWHQTHKEEPSSIPMDSNEQGNGDGDNGEASNAEKLSESAKKNDTVGPKIVVEDTADDVIEVEYISPEDWQARQERLRVKKQKDALEAEKMKQTQQNGSKQGSTAASAASDRATRRTRNANRPRRPVSRDFGVASSRIPRVPSDYIPKKHDQRPPTNMNSRPNARRAASTSPQNKNGAPQKTQQARKVYSPYGSDRSGFMEDEDVEMKDGLNRFGDFLADSVDSLLWGPDDEEDYEIIDVKPHATRNDTATTSDNAKRKRAPSSARSRSSTTSGNWKDRLEERVDTVLGIRQDGSTYQRWMNKERQDEADATGTDAVSYARGRATKPKRRQPNKSRRRLYDEYYNDDIDDKPFWEQDGDIFSILFGNNGGGGRRNNRGGYFPSRYADGSFLGDLYNALHSSSLSLLLRSLLVFSARIFGRLTRWASVYDTIPRPVVAFILFAAGISTRGRLSRRVMNMAFALLSTRVIGEWLDGFLTDSLEDDGGTVEEDSSDGSGTEAIR